jgi:hypothetical protein
VVFVPTPIQPPESPRVRELSRKIQELIAEFQQRYPMTPAEIRQALFHAAGTTGGYPRRLLAVVAGGLAAMLGFGVFAYQRVEGGGITWAPIAVAVGVAAAAVGLVVAARQNR